MGSSRLVSDLFQPLGQFLPLHRAQRRGSSPSPVGSGLGEASKISLIIYATVFVVLLSSMIGVSAVARNKVRAARCLGAPPTGRFFSW